MTVILLVLFWGSVSLTIYSYFIFPSLVLLRGFICRRPYECAAIEPFVSLIIAAHNEADNIAGKLENALALDYPHDRCEVIVASDGSTDATDRIVHRYAQRGIRLLSLPRCGKAQALNAAVATAHGEILVFSDATSIFARNALRRLVRPFADPQVGGVAGNLIYRQKEHKILVEDGEQLHLGLDRRLKIAASRAGSALSASGAMNAIRRTLFQTVPEGVTDDFVISTRVIAQGYRLVFADDALAYDPAAKSDGAEFHRKVRVITRGFRSVFVMRELLNPFRYGFYSLQLFSHKIIRRLLVLALLALLVLAPQLWHRGLFYQVATLAQVGVYGLAASGLFLRGTSLRKRKVFAIPFYFCLVNGASLLAAINVLRGNRIIVWEPQRPVEESSVVASGATIATKGKLL